MKLSSLLAQRQAMLERARLANLAFAYDRLSDFTRRIARAGLAGAVRLQPAAPEAQRYLPALTALQGSQSVIEEHFDEEDLLDLADVIAFTTGENEPDLSFRLEDIRNRFLLPVRAQLKEAGIAIDGDNQSQETSHEDPADCTRSEEDD